MDRENIVFDLVDVLFTIDYEKKAKKLHIAEGRYAYFKDHILTHQMWKEMKRGLYSFDEGREIFIDIFPEYRDVIHLLLDNDWTDIIQIHKENRQLLEKFKANQQIQDLYIMADILPEQGAYLQTIEKFLDPFTGCMYSYEVKLLRSDRQIYELFLERYNLNKENTFFITGPNEDLLAKEMATQNNIQLISIADIKELDM